MKKISQMQPAGNNKKGIAQGCETGEFHNPMLIQGCLKFKKITNTKVVFDNKNVTGASNISTWQSSIK